ncbi:MAG: peptidylprolyl isomerase [Anaerolineaceae bacterium]|nr:peptidylprolyl isomerase [Anaerolineaceae bacterium]
MKRMTALLLALCFLLGVILTACKNTEPNSVPATALPPATLQMATNTPEPTPTATPIPAVLTVNGIGIPLAYFEDELSRYKISFAQGEAAPADPEAITAVTDYLTEQLLLASAARQEAYHAGPEEVDKRLQELTAKLGSAEKLNEWTSANYYDAEQFRFFIALGAEAAWQRDKILASIPDATEQVRARQIFSTNEASINQAYNNLNAGTDFAQLAKNFNPDTGGELGWFPRGYLLIPAIEEFAFSAGLGAHSAVIQSDIGYHIIEVTDKDPRHPLTTDAKLSLQAKALAAWLQDAKSRASITLNLP